jgi:hypothetical protein
MNHPYEKAHCACNTEGFRNTTHNADYLSFQQCCKHSAVHIYGLYYEGHRIRILRDGSFVVWAYGQIKPAKNFEKLQTLVKELGALS